MTATPWQSSRPPQCEILNHGDTGVRDRRVLLDPVREMLPLADFVLLIQVQEIVRAHNGPGLEMRVGLGLGL